MYLGSIIGYLSLPFMIVVSYLVVRWAIRAFEKKQEAAGGTDE